MWGPGPTDGAPGWGLRAAGGDGDPQIWAPMGCGTPIWGQDPVYEDPHRGMQPPIGEWRPPYEHAPGDPNLGTETPAWGC